jgi:folate-binding protein YgfZ
MPESVLAPAPQATPLATHLAAPVSEYLGTLTPQHFDAPAAETRALLQGAAVHDLGWLRRIAVRGADNFRWLSGMVTNTVEALPCHHGAYNLILNAQGRIQGDAYLWHEGDSLELEFTCSQADALLAHLDHFIIMDDVELVPITTKSAIGLTGPHAPGILASLGVDPLPELLTSVRCTINSIAVEIDRAYGAVVPHYAIWAETAQIPALWQAIQAAGARPAGAAALETLRIVEGIPAYGIDIQSRDLPQETSQDRALHFTKGCYLGQEIVERIRSRGQVHRHLRHLELTPGDSGAVPTPGVEIRKAGSAPEAKPAGELTSIAEVTLGVTHRIFALAMIRSEAEIGNPVLTYPGGNAQILKAAPGSN